MINTDEILENIFLDNTDLLHIEEIPLTSEDRELVTQKTLQKIQCIQNVNQGNGSHKYKKTSKIILKRTLIAAILLISTTIFATANSPTIKEIFRNIFHEGISNIENDALALDLTNSQKGVTLILKGVVGDNNTTTLAFDLEKKDGLPFKGGDIRFGDITFKTENSTAYPSQNPSNVDSTLGITSWTSYKEINSLQKDSLRRSFELKCAGIDELDAKNAILSITNIIEYEKYDILSEATIGDLLASNQINSPISIIPNEDMRYKNNIKTVDQNIPNHILTPQKLNIAIFDEYANIQLQSIGFIDNNLHVQLSGSQGTLYLKDNNNIVEPTYIVRKDNSGYFVYTSVSKEDFYEMRFSMPQEKEINRIDGTWDVKFDFSIRTETKSIYPVNQSVLFNNLNWNVDELNLSNLSLDIVYELSEFPSIYPSVKIIFTQDENDINIYQEGVNVWNNNKVQLIYRFDNPIDTSQVEAILINDTRISIK